MLIEKRQKTPFLTSVMIDPLVYQPPHVDSVAHAAEKTTTTTRHSPTRANTGRTATKKALNTSGASPTPTEVTPPPVFLKHHLFFFKLLL
jgi:predicted ATPase with chaperone activity